MSHRRLAALALAALSLVAFAFSASHSRRAVGLPLPPTEAWKRLFNNGTNDDFVGAGAQPATDASGYCYFNYATQTSPGNYTLHLVKIGPSMNIAFDKTELFNGVSSMTPMGVFVGPLIAGKQYIYTIFQYNAGNNLVRINGYDTSGNQWVGGPYTEGSFSGGQDCNFLGAGTDASGNFYLGLSNADAGGHRQFEMIESTGNGSNTVNFVADGNVDPYEAAYSRTLNRWIVAGHDLATVAPYSSRWALVDPTTGTETSFSESLGSHDSGTGAFVSYGYTIALLPGDAFGVGLDNESYAGSGIPHFSYWVQTYNADGTTDFRYPSTGTVPSNLLGMAGLNGNWYIFDVPGLAVTRPSVTLLDATGNTIYRHTNQPVGRVYPDASGFYTLWASDTSNTVFLEHYNNAALAFDWGKSYAGNNVLLNEFGGLAMFQNFFYVTLNLSDTPTGYDVLVDRFVTGICLQNISSSGSVTGGQSIAVTIQLNGPAPNGGLVVALNSSTAKLLMPNGTRAQNFTVLQGQSQLVVNLNAQPVVSQTVATLLAIQNGIRRPAAVTINP